MKKTTKVIHTVLSFLLVIFVTGVIWGGAEDKTGAKAMIVGHVYGFEHVVGIENHLRVINQIQQKYGKESLNKAFQELIKGDLKDLNYRDFDRDSKEQMRRNLFKRLGAVIPSFIDLQESLKTLIENKEAEPKTRIYALQTLLRRHPLEAQKYATKTRKKWMKFRKKDEATKEEQKLGHWAYTSDWLDGYSPVREKGGAGFIKYKDAAILIKQYKNDKSIDRRKIQQAFEVAINSPIIRSKWKKKKNFPREAFLDIADKWIQGDENDKERYRQRRFYKMVALFGLLDEEMPEKYRERVEELSEEEKEKLQYWHTQFKYNLDAYDLK